MVKTTQKILPTHYASKWQGLIQQHQAKSFCFHFLSLWKLGKQFCRLGKENHLLVVPPLEDSAGTAMLALLQPSSVDKLQNGRKSPILSTPLHDLGSESFNWLEGFLTYRVQINWWFTFGWQGAVRKHIHAAPVAREDMKSNRQSWPFPILALSALPLMEWSLDHFQYFSLNFTCTNFKIASAQRLRFAILGYVTTGK